MFKQNHNTKNIKTMLTHTVLTKTNKQTKTQCQNTEYDKAHQYTNIFNQKHNTKNIKQQD